MASARCAFRLGIFVNSFLMRTRCSRIVLIQLEERCSGWNSHFNRCARSTARQFSNCCCWLLPKSSNSSATFSLSMGSPARTFWACSNAHAWKSISCRSPVNSFTLETLLHLDRQNLIVQLRAPRRKARHRSGKADVTPQRSDLDHQLVALFEQSDLAFHGKRQLEPHLISPIGFRKGVRSLGANNGGGIFLAVVQRTGELLKPFAAHHLVREQRHPLD